MDWLSLLVGGILGFILGIFVPGVRRMLATFIIKRRILVGGISKSIQGNAISWSIPIRVKASIWWNLLVSSVEDVQAMITLAKRKRHFQTAWVNPTTADLSLIALRIGTVREIGLAEQYSDLGNLKMYDEIVDDNFTVDDDILLELRTGDISLGQWLFPKAIVAGHMQQVMPTKLKVSYKEDSKT